MYLDKTNKFSIGELNKYRTDDSKTKFYFQLSLEQAFDIVTSTCFDLDIPLYYPLKDDSQQIIKIKSGNFVAKLGLDLLDFSYFNKLSRTIISFLPVESKYRFVV